MSNVVLDTDFLSSFLKIRQLDRIQKLFRADRLWVPPAVYREIAVTDLLPVVAKIEVVRIRKVGRDHLAALSTDRDFSTLGSGEQEAIALAKTLADSVLLMSDRRAGRCARRLGVDVVDIPAFLLACRRSGETTVETTGQLIEALREKDHYSFSKAVLELLLS